MNFIDLFNAVAKVAKPAHAGVAVASSMDDKFADIGIDSLDGLIMLMYMCEIYGVAESVSKEWMPHNVKDLHDLLMAHKTREPESIESAIKGIQ